MKQLKIAYFNQLGRRELDQAKTKFEEEYPDTEVKLISTGYDEAFEKMADGEADLVIADKRDKRMTLKEKILLKLV